MTTEKNILTVSEASDLLGFKPSYLYKLIHFRRIPHSKPMGGRVFFSRTELEAWAMRNPVKMAEKFEVPAATHVSTHS